MKNITTEINSLEMGILLGCFFIVGWIAHMTFRNQFDKSHTIVNCENRGIRVEIDGVGITIDKHDTWIIR